MTNKYMQRCSISFNYMGNINLNCMRPFHAPQISESSKVTVPKINKDVEQQGLLYSAEPKISLRTKVSIKKKKNHGRRKEI